jgi:hypothetical protein
MLVSLHPQFIISTMFISNDPLAILLGLALLAVAYRYIRQCTFRNLVAVAVVLGLGLATKFTFLAFIVPVVVVLWVASHREGLGMRRTVAMLASLILIVALLGSYKFVANAQVTGNPLASNIDLWPWAARQRPTWVGPATVLDMNLTKLLRNPIVSEETVHSYPLMLYASYWYEYFPDSTFRSNTKPGLNVLGSLIYLCAMVPTALIIVGFWAIVKRSARWLGRESLDESAARRATHGVEILALLMLAMNLALIVSVGWRHDVYSVFNSRLLFPAYFAFLVSLARGIDWSASHWRRLHSTGVVALRVLHGLFLVYLALDVAIAIVRPVDPLRTDHMPYRPDMTKSSGR